MTQKRAKAAIAREEAYRRGTPVPLDKALAALQGDEGLAQEVEGQIAVATARLIGRVMKARGIHLTQSESDDLARGLLAVVGTRLAAQFKPTPEVTAHFKRQLDGIRRVAA